MTSEQELRTLYSDFYKDLTAINICLNRIIEQEDKFGNLVFIHNNAKTSQELVQNMRSIIEKKSDPNHVEQLELLPNMAPPKPLSYSHATLSPFNPTNNEQKRAKLEKLEKELELRMSFDRLYGNGKGGE